MIFRSFFEMLYECQTSVTHRIQRTIKGWMGGRYRRAGFHGNIAAGKHYAILSGQPNDTILLKQPSPPTFGSHTF